MTCQQELRRKGLPYPRTCQECGLGPCKHSKSGAGASVTHKFFVSHEEWFPVYTLISNSDGSFKEESLKEFTNKEVEEMKRVQEDFIRIQRMIADRIGKKYEKHHEYRLVD